MAAPTRAEVYAQLTEYLRKAEEAAATLAHLTNEDGKPSSKVLAIGWLNVAEGMKKVRFVVIELMKGVLN